MTINSIKELQALIKMLKKEGVDAIKIDNLEFCIIQKAPQASRKSTRMVNSAAYTPLAPGGIQEDTRIITDELTEDQLLHWSSQGSDQQ